ncbi:MAG: electron transfer flavoprotein subunit beta/FixA family protein [Bacteroidia bacterium]|nr:electron transfer flavoprotein subunit beta/FixA family protein [Bacteroidia bacterium]
MNLLVCISKTPETTAKIAFKENDTQFDTDGVQFIMNPYDEWYALVRAIELKEQLGTGKVIAINIGPPSNDVVIRKALAIGADEAVRVNGEEKSATFVSKQIANYAKENNIDIVFLGKETIDYNGSLVGGMISELLDVPFLSYASNLEMEGDTATVTCDIEGGEEILKVKTPFVISAAKGLAEQRIPNMRGIMMAKRKPLVVIDPVEVTENEAIASYSIPDSKSGVKLLDPENMDELVRLLHEEAKVI